MRLTSTTLVLLLLTAAATGGAGGANDAKQPPAVKEPALRQELLAMQQEDQRVRAECLKELGSKGVSALDREPITDPALLKFVERVHAKMAQTDARHRARLKAIVARYGWPGKTLVGRDAARAAWLLVQHADRDLVFQKQCLALMRAAPKGEVEPVNLAYLTDRVLVGEKKKQRYGTQLLGVGGAFKSQPIEDEANVDKRRAEVGLPPLAEYLRTAQEQYAKYGRKPKKSEPGPFRVVGYLPDYRMKTLDPSVGLFLTDLVYFSAEAEPSGELNLRRLRAKDVQRLQQIKAKYGVRLLLCVGGWGRSRGFPQLAGSPQARQRFVTAVTRFCLENRFDGIDLDWEHPANATERQNHAALLTALKKGLAPHKLRLTVAVAGWQVLSADAVKAVDDIHLMAYDGRGRHSTYEFAQAEVARLEKQGVPAARICLGVPFYGRGVKEKARVLTYAELVRKYRPAADVDEVDGIYFNGLKTVERKTKYALARKLGGVMVWELGQDAGGEASLLRAIHRIVAGAN
jgi:hypothetical protein